MTKPAETAKKTSEELETHASSSSNKGIACLAIGCVVVMLGSFLVAAGIGAFLVWKVKNDPSFFEKFSAVPGIQSILPTGVIPIPTGSVKKTSEKREALVTVFTYPESRLLSRVDDTPDGYQINLSMETGDAVLIAKRYYQTLISYNGWGSRPVEASLGGIEYLDIVQPDFQASISIETNVTSGKTEIYVGITFDTEEIRSTMSIPKEIVPATPTPTFGAVTRANAGDYVLSFSSGERVVRSDLVGLSPWNLKVARNEIYARHGRPFVSKDLTCYFVRKSWYSLDQSYTDARLSKLELENAVFILNYEKSIGSLIYDKDTGCGTN